MQCDKCGAESPLTAMFIRRKRSFRNSTQNICPRCFHWARGVRAKAFLKLYIVLLLFCLAAAAWNPTDFLHSHLVNEWSMFINLALATVFSYLCLVLHELGHAIAGWLVQFNVWRITIGHGPMIKKIQAGKLLLEWRVFPVGGSVEATSSRMFAWRLRRLIIVAGGPLVYVLLIALAAAAIHGEFGMSDVDWNGIYPWQVLALTSAIMLVGTLVGPPIRTARGVNTRDGFKMYQLLFKPISSVEQRQLVHTVAEANSLTLRKQYKAAAEMVNDALRRSPSDPRLKIALMDIQFNTSDYLAARQSVIELLEGYARNDAYRATMKNYLAWGDLMIGDSQSLDEANKASEEAFSLLPWEAGIQSTRGHLLIEQGQIDQGMDLLRRAIRGVENRSDEASVLCSMALGEFKRGNAQAAQKLLNKATRLDKDCELLPRVRRELEQSPSAPPAPILNPATPA